MADFHLQIATADGLLYDGPAERVIVRTTEGDVGLLKGHIDYVAALKDVSELRLTADGKTRIAAVSGGFVSVTKEITHIFATTLEWADEIDKNRAEHAKEIAEKRLQEKKQEDLDHKLAELKLKRAINRIRVADKR